MGVRGLENFIFRNRNFWKDVDIIEAIDEWTRRNPESIVMPIIVFDCGHFSFQDALCTSKELYFSGELNRFDRALEKWLERLEQKAELVFFKVLAAIKHTAEEWTMRQDKESQEWFKFYGWIEEGRKTLEILKDCPSVIHDLEHTLLQNCTKIISNYGDLKFGHVGRDTDREIAQFATTNNVLAVFARDTDFMIFDGHWKFWSYVRIDLDSFKVKEYDRLMLNQELLLTFEQRPVFASVMGNGFTWKYADNLRRFHGSLGRMRMGHKFRHVAQYIRRIFNERNLSLDDIDEIVDVVAQDIFGNECDDEKRQAIIDSIKSYDICGEAEDTRTEEEGEEGEISKRRLLNMQWNRAHIHHNIKVIQRKKWIYLRDTRQSKRLNDFFTEMVRKQVGLVNPDCINLTFKLITKKSLDDSCQIYDENPIFLPFAMPSLNDFYTADDSNENLNAVRWDVLAWLLSISKAEKNALMSCDQEFRAVCATLLVLVQRGIVSIETADSILVAEKMGRDDRVPYEPMVETLNPDHVETSMCYSSCYEYVTHAFEYAGLANMPSKSFKFDVFFYQNLMAAGQLDKAENDSIAHYRIYID